MVREANKVLCFLAILTIPVPVLLKIFGRCELAHYILDEGLIKSDWSKELPKWMCIANKTGYDSLFLMKNGTYPDGWRNNHYGIFAIRSFVCSESCLEVRGSFCGSHCIDMLEDDLKNSIRCANDMSVWLNHWREWSRFAPECVDDSVEKSHFLEGCEVTVKVRLEVGNYTLNECERNARIICTATGYPLPNVTIEGGHIGGGRVYSDFKMNKGRPTASVVFKLVLLEDAGQYKCIADNGYTHAEADIDVVVNPRKPGIGLVSGNSSWMGREGFLKPCAMIPEITESPSTTDSSIPWTTPDPTFTVPSTESSTETTTESSTSTEQMTMETTTESTVTATFTSTEVISSTSVPSTTEPPKTTATTESTTDHIAQSSPRKPPDTASSLWALGIIIALGIPFAALFIHSRAKGASEFQEIYRNFKYGTNQAASQDSAFTDPKYHHILGVPFPKSLICDSDRIQVYIRKVLGKGAFGTVYQGQFNFVEKAAIKTVSGAGSVHELRSLLVEAKILGGIGRHPNIITLLGVDISSVKQGIAYVALEYCELGSLKSLLDKKREAMLFNSNNLYRRQFYLPGYLQTHLVPSRFYRSGKGTLPFPDAQLMGFCIDVCRGMEFLAANRVVHGDLAARNVLINRHFTAKITDFGLSHQLPGLYKNYANADRGTLLPWRWVPVETLKYLRFSEASDVWAFGVLMWEIYSYGELPYTAGVEWSNSFMSFLEQGFRLQKPAYGSEEIYQIMLQCWRLDAYERPRFSILRNVLESTAGSCSSTQSLLASPQTSEKKNHCRMQ